MNWVIHTVLWILTDACFSQEYGVRYTVVNGDNSYLYWWNRRVQLMGILGTFPYR
jgi:hypothetical protein